MDIFVGISGFMSVHTYYSVYKFLLHIYFKQVLKFKMKIALQAILLKPYIEFGTANIISEAKALQTLPGDTPWSHNIIEYFAFCPSLFMIYDVTYDTSFDIN